MEKLKQDIFKIIRKIIRPLHRIRQSENTSTPEHLSNIGKIEFIIKELRKFSFSINALLIVSGIQIAIAFQRGDFSIQAWLKAIAIEYTIGRLNRGMATAHAVGLKTWFSWVVLIFLMLITIHANLRYGYFEILNTSNLTWVLIIACDTWQHSEVLLYSLPIPLLILGLSYAQQSQMLAIDIYAAQERERIKESARDEEKRLKAREYYKNYLKKQQSKWGRK